ncbi:MAG: flagellar basal body rod protein FlgC [Aquabacterium sp.]
MSFKDIARIAGSAMTAQTVRLNTVASNLANAETSASTEAGAYKARKPVFASVFEQSASQGSGAGVRVLDVVESREPTRKAYEPDNPLANEQGEVFYSNVNPVAEMTDMMSASRAFETNVEVLGRVRGMQQSLLKLGDAS